MADDFDFASIKVLLDQADGGLRMLETEYAESVRTLKPTAAFRVGTLNHLVQHRAILDYLAHGFVPMCTREPRKVYFPIAKAGMIADEFRDLVDRRWFPGLVAARPDVFEVLDSIQGYHLDNNWINAFATLANSNKHIRLTLMTIAGCDATAILLPWGYGMQIGDRGLARSVTIEEGGSLVFTGVNNQRLAIRGPQLIDRDTKSLLHADEGISVVKREWQEFKFDDYPQQPAMVFLQIVNTQVRRIVDRILPLVPEGN